MKNYIIQDISSLKGYDKNGNEIINFNNVKIEDFEVCHNITQATDHLGRPLVNFNTSSNFKATISANTVEFTTPAMYIAKPQNSPEVVGSALKILSDRLYTSNILATVGIDVIDNNGKMRKMEDVLNELSIKWKLLDTNQQTRLAQSLTGTLNYKELISIIEDLSNNVKVYENFASLCQDNMFLN